jgi:hypothetical protein
MINARETFVDRRRALECMIWTGSGVVWSLAVGVPDSILIGAAVATESAFSSDLGRDQPRQMAH